VDSEALHSEAIDSGNWNGAGRSMLIDTFLPESS